MGRTKVRLLQALEDSGSNLPNDLAKYFIAKAISAYRGHEVSLALALG